LTCVLEAKEEVNANDQGPFRHDRPTLRLHGSWKVHPNPFCPTDRFYETVEFAFSSSSGASSSSSRATTGAAVGNTCAGDLVMVGRCHLKRYYSPGRLLFSRTNAVRPGSFVPQRTTTMSTQRSGARPPQQPARRRRRQYPMVPVVVKQNNRFLSLWVYSHAVVEKTNHFRSLQKNEWETVASFQKHLASMMRWGGSVIISRTPVRRQLPHDVVGAREQLYDVFSDVHSRRPTTTRRRRVPCVPRSDISSELFFHGRFFYILVAFET
jgi:hypothetical protein